MTDHNTPGRNNHARAIIDHTTANRAAAQDELLTITEVADILRAPVATLRYWRHLGTGPHSFRIGRGVRYWHHNVTTWLQQQSSACDQRRPRNTEVKPGAGRAGSRDRQHLERYLGRVWSPENPQNGPRQWGAHNFRGNVP
jgi:Helix-turn-helix domain